MAEHRYSLGQIVVFRSAVEVWRLRNTKWKGLTGDFPNAFVVNERIRQECPGGIQLQYNLRMGLAGDKPTLIQEHELISWDEFSEIHKSVSVE